MKLEYLILTTLSLQNALTISKINHYPHFVPIISYCLKLIEINPDFICMLQLTMKINVCDVSKVQ